MSDNLQQVESIWECYDQFANREHLITPLCDPPHQNTPVVRKGNLHHNIERSSQIAPHHEYQNLIFIS